MPLQIKHAVSTELQTGKQSVQRQLSSSDSPLQCSLIPPFVNTVVCTCVADVTFNNHCMLAAKHNSCILSLGCYSLKLPLSMRPLTIDQGHEALVLMLISCL